MTRRRFDLIPWYAIREASHILDMGLSKHGFETWKQIDSRTHLDCAMSHIGYWMDGQKLDNESGRSHLQHAFIRILFALANELASETLASRLSDIQSTVEDSPTAPL